MGKPFTPERLASIRRMRKARRLYKKEPLLAYHILCGEYPSYTHDDFWEDLRYRTKRKRKKKNKTPLSRYGRYERMKQLIAMYKDTANTDYGMKAQRLRNLMTKPYRVMVRIEGEVLEYRISPLIQITEIEKLVAQLPKCKTEQEADDFVEQFGKTAFVR